MTDMDSKVKKHTTMKSSFFIVPILAAMVIISVQCHTIKEYEGVMCTEIYMHIPLKLEYSDGQPVLLDSSKVFWVSKNRYLEQDSVHWNEARVWGNYCIVDDKMRKELYNKKEVMRFTGYLDGKIICEHDVLVGADHCHVNYLGVEPLILTIPNISAE
jgi:hypothetical protein